MLEKRKTFSGAQISEWLSGFLEPDNFYKSYIFPSEKINSKALIRYGKRNGAKSLYWRKPSENFAFFSIGNIKEFTSSESEKIIDEINFVRKNFKSNIDEFSETNFPYIVGGVKFNGKSDSKIWGDFNFNNWFIPRISFILINGFHFIEINTLPGESFTDIKEEVNKLINVALLPLNEESGEEGLKPKIKKNGNHDKIIWDKKITEALRLIINNELDKIVVSRFVNHTLSVSPDYHNILSELSSSFPFCIIFGFNSGSSFFFGATPETLFSVNNSELETDALAGSISRGKNIYEDDTLANELLASDKNLREHKKVVDFLISRLEKHTSTIMYKDTPKIRKLRNIQHLWTPIRAKLKSNVNLLSILYDIHPTPAVCGSPQNIAYKHIPLIENFERGLFTGVIGWFNFSDVGDFSVAIRSGLIKGNELNAYAGCGIVNGSDADEEFIETKLKLQPVLSLFEEDEY